MYLEGPFTQPISNIKSNVESNLDARNKNQANQANSEKSWTQEDNRSYLLDDFDKLKAMVTTTGYDSLPRDIVELDLTIDSKALQWAQDVVNGRKVDSNTPMIGWATMFAKRQVCEYNTSFDGGSFFRPIKEVKFIDHWGLFLTHVDATKQKSK
ncbi:hypothetical protein PSN45_004842 [Yamadazyma tenuis]|uniref:uncharacterized protein n=1 Tax=Candida tenuis TaxID=2315449 RepID=UPI0027A86FD5|nr:hypothetical protein PSN45_004842 [Yamadazyma tenuis]